jgi:hypothetical protein
MNDMCCSWCDKLLIDEDDGVNPEMRRRACLGCIKRHPDRFAPLTAEEQAWANAPCTTSVSPPGVAPAAEPKE